MADSVTEDSCDVAVIRTRTRTPFLSPLFHAKPEQRKMAVFVNALDFVEIITSVVP